MPSRRSLNRQKRTLHKKIYIGGGYGGGYGGGFGGGYGGGGYPSHGGYHGGESTKTIIVNVIPAEGGYGNYL